MREVEGPVTAAVTAELVDAVHAAVEQLPLHYRQVLTLRLVHGLELQQIAHALGAPLGTVKAQLHRGTAMLRRALPAGLAGALAVVFSPGRGLAAVREVVLGHAGATAGAAAGTFGAVLVGVLAMNKLLLAGGVAALAVAGWFVYAAAAPALGGATGGAAMAPKAVVEAADATVPPIALVPRADSSSIDAPQRRELATTGGVDLMVKWADDDTPALGVRVRLLRRGATPAEFSFLVAVTDTNGCARWRDEPPGICSVVGDPKAQKIEIKAGEIATATTRIDGQVFAITVVDAQGQPQSDADVWADCEVSRAEGPRQRVLGRTGIDGRVSCHALDVYLIIARKAGRVPSTWTRVRAAGLEPKSRQDYRLVLGDTACDVLGRVVDPTGRPVAGATVIVACDESLQSTLLPVFTTADREGRYALSEVPAGEHSAKAFAPGFAPASASVTARSNAPVMCDLQLRIGATLMGCVTTSTGAAVEGAEINCRAKVILLGLGAFSEDVSSANTTSDASGHFRLPALPVGEAWVSVRKSGLPTAQRGLSLADGGTTTWDPVLHSGGEIVGRLLDADAKPLVGWRIDSWAGSGVQNPTAFSNAEGAFHLSGLEDRDYRLLAFAPAMGPASQVPRASVDMMRPPQGDLIVRVSAAALAEGWIDGSIVQEAREAGVVALSLNPASPEKRGFVVPMERLEAGISAFHIGPLPPGDYDLTCDIDGRGTMAQRGLHVVAGQRLALPPFLANAQHRLRLSLRHGDGSVAAGATLRLHGHEGQEPCSEETAGVYVSVAVDPGSYMARVHGPDFAPCTFPVEVDAAADTAVEHTVPVATTVALHIKPVTPKGDRWVGGLMALLRDGHDTEVLRDIVAIDGHAEFVWRLGLLPGHYVLKANVYGEGKAEVAFDVGAAGTAPQDVTVQLAK
jgi:hypothetical protein